MWGVRKGESGGMCVLGPTGTRLGRSQRQYGWSRSGGTLLSARAGRQNLVGNQAEDEGLCWGLGSGVTSKPRVSEVSSVRFLPWNGRCILEAMGSQATDSNGFPCHVRGEKGTLTTYLAQDEKSRNSF